MDGRSWLRWGQDNDVDVYEAAERAGKLTKGTGRIETFEWSQEATLLNRVVVELAHLSHITAVKGTRNAKKKFKAPKIAWPRTAVEGLKERYQAAASTARQAFFDMIETQPQAEWEAEMAEHQAALEAGVPSPVQERAMERARAATEPDAGSPTVERGGLGLPGSRVDQ